METLDTRLHSAIQICRRAGSEAMGYFERSASLRVDTKGAQDWVSEADVAVERFVRNELARAFPDDGIVGEEDAPKAGISGFDWVIDPIDGTTNFINGIPAWTVVLAGVAQGQTQVGVIYDPSADEMFAAARGGGATLNEAPIFAARDTALGQGTVAVGYSNRVDTKNILQVVAALIERGAMFHRNASGALSLAYVASGRLLGYMEEHMNAWDCLAGQLLIEEAGGTVEPQDAGLMIRDGGRVVVGCADVFDDLQSIADAAWAP